MVRRLEPKDLPHQFGGSPEEVGRNLDSLTKANRYFGGVRSLARPLHRLLLGHRGRPVRLLDVGCGRAEAARRHVEWARAQAIDLRVTVVDRDADVIAHARRGCQDYPEIRIRTRDPIAEYLPYSLTRTWHLQTAMFWIATAFLAAGLFLAPAVVGGGAMDLAERSRGRGLELERAELGLPVGAKLGGHAPAHERATHRRRRRLQLDELGRVFLG